MATDYDAWDRKVEALAKQAADEDAEEEAKSIIASRPCDNVTGLPRPVVDGASYLVRAMDNLAEEITVERSATVASFVQKVRGEFFLEVKELCYHDPNTNTKVDLTLPVHEEKILVDLVPPGTALKIGNPQLHNQVANDATNKSVSTTSPLQCEHRVGDNHLHCHAGPPVALSTGDRVKVVGLQGRPELNDKMGKLERWVAGKDRWEVRLDSMQSSDAPLGLRPANLQPADGKQRKMKTGFLSGGLGDDRSRPRGALLFLSGSGESGDAFRQKLSELSAGTFETNLRAAGIQTLKFPCRKGVIESSIVRAIDWLDPATTCRPDAQEDIAGICESLEIVDAEIDKIVNAGIPPERIGLAGCGSGGCLSLHLAYGEGRYAGKLGAVACSRSFLTEDSVLPKAAMTRFHKGALPSPPLFMSHGAKDTLVQEAWVLFTRSCLGAAGVKVPSEVAIFPDAAHDLCGAEIQEMIEFFICHLIDK